MFSRQAISRLAAPSRTSTFLRAASNIAVPSSRHQARILTRNPDRPLPDPAAARRRNIITLTAFLTLSAGAAAGIFNYQKSSSSVVSSTLYALRAHEEARQLLGDEIQFASKMPWISGTLNQLHGKIDISYRVKGTKSKGTMRFKSVRRSRMALFETELWELTMDDGRKLVMLNNSPVDPANAGH